MTHYTLGCCLEHLLRVNVPGDRVKAQSFHSFQALARPRSDKGMAVYARLNPDGSSTWALTALQQNTTSRTEARLPVVIDDHDTAVAFEMAGTFFRQVAADVAGENTSDGTGENYAHPLAAAVEAGQEPSLQRSTGTRKPLHGGLTQRPRPLQRAEAPPEGVRLARGGARRREYLSELNPFPTPSPNISLKRYALC